MTVWRVREATIQYRRRDIKDVPRQVLSSSEPAAKVFTEIIGTGTVERIAVLCLDTRLALTCYGIVGQGGEASSTVSVTEILRLAILSGSTGVILGHNHPSGELVASPEDVELTKRVREACTLVSLRFLDHIIVNSDGDFFSFLDAGLLTRC